MIFAILTLLSSLTIAAIAAWFSIAGLVAVFSASPMSVGIMAGALEVGKLITASWLYRNWKQAPLLLKSYLTIAVIVLMFITSMGIFGYLSKAHLDQNLATSDSAARIERIEEKIQREQRKIDGASAQIDNLDTAIQNWIEGGYMTRAMNAREKQADDRKILEGIIISSEEEISKLKDEQFPLSQELRVLENEVGPALYIAELLYGSDAENDLDRAVRILILILVAVFDPLAVLLLIAANYSLVRNGIVLERPDGEISETAELPKPSLKKRKKE